MIVRGIQTSTLTKMEFGVFSRSRMPTVKLGCRNTKQKGVSKMEKKYYYKATDANMRCKGYQFVLGEWSEPIKGELEMCKNGYHFCEQPSGVWAYYSAEGTRVFKCEVKDAIFSKEPGADAKSICRQVKLIEEIEIDGDCNTGHRNTGDRNTGDHNTGYGNTGDRNTGDHNTGYGNTGHRNTGHRNTGDRNTGYGNTGDCNTGYGNTGDCNTGDYNTGNYNTGDCNTGDYNTGHCNIGNYQTGAFGLGNAQFTSFGLPADRDLFPWDIARWFWDEYLGIPNATVERLKEFHEAYKKAKGIE
jgi:hypothetical protein